MAPRLALFGAGEMVGESGSQQKSAHFEGAYPARLDDKGRVPIPMQFRNLLGPDATVVTTIYVVDGCSCLEAYPVPVWEKYVSDFETKTDLLETDLEHFRSVYLGAAQRCQLDRQGRILVPQTLRALAELEHEVQIVGVGSRMRIFDKNRYARVVKSLLEKLSHPRGGLGGLPR
jgi:MraZ protein